MTDIVERLKDKCNGHPFTKILWPHNLLHDAIAEIERLRTIETASMSLRDAAEAVGEIYAKNTSMWDRLNESIILYDNVVEGVDESKRG